MTKWVGEASTFHGLIEGAGVVSAQVPLLDADALLAEVLTLDPLEAIALMPPRRLLLVHGDDDVEVPSTDARELLAAAGGHAELRIIQGAGHQMRADPRMVATLLGWLDRYR
jgi:fermentation-respiration switch protein FrsA (DUF1100 family)